MIGPLGQRQIHAVSNVEAMRQALDVGDQQTREVARKRAADDRLAEASQEVPQISGAMGLRTEERQSRQGRNPEGGGEGAAGAEGEGGPAAEPGDSAKTAEWHLDFLA